MQLAKIDIKYCEGVQIGEYSNIADKTLLSTTKIQMYPSTHGDPLLEHKTTKTLSTQLLRSHQPFAFPGICCG